VGGAVTHSTFSGSDDSKQRPQFSQNTLSLIFFSAQFGHFLTATAFVHKSSFLHDIEQRKKVQPEGKADRPEVGRLLVNETLRLSWDSNVSFAGDGGHVVRTSDIEAKVV
jgi:hypothetical protein